MLNMRRMAKYLLIVCTSFMLSSCIISLQDFTLHGISNVRLEGWSSASADLKVESNAPVGVRITAGELTLYYNNQQVATATLDNDPRIRRRRTEDVHIEVSIKVHNPIALLSVLNAIESHPERLTVSGFGEARVGPFRKRMTREDVPISKFIAIFGDPTKYISI